MTPPATASTYALHAPLPATTQGVEQGDAPAAASDVPGRILDMVAQRATLHRSLLYRFQCTEHLTRRVIRRHDFSLKTVASAETKYVRSGIVLERGEDGLARAVRVEVNRKGKARMSKTGEPVEVKLPRQFDRVAKVVPHADAAVFTAEGQGALAFRLLTEEGGRDYRIECADGHMRVEFLDRKAPRPAPECSAQASGQMCVDPGNGEISLIAFYGLDRLGDRCAWNREAPFAVIEQGVIESTSGARFPSRVKTSFSLDRGGDAIAIFEQRFQDCRFTNVEVKEIYGGPVDDDPKP